MPPPPQSTASVNGSGRAARDHASDGRPPGAHVARRRADVPWRPRRAEHDERRSSGRRCTPEPAVRLRLDLAYDGTGFAGWARPAGRCAPSRGCSRPPWAPCLRTDGAAARDGRRADRRGRARARAGGARRRRRPGARGVPRALATARSTRCCSPASAGVLPAGRRGAPRDAGAPAGFDARFSALRRRYAYRICDDPALRDPLSRTHVLWHRRPLDVDGDGTRPRSRWSAGTTSRRSASRGRARRRSARSRRSRGRGRSTGPTRGSSSRTVQADAFCHSMVRVARRREPRRGGGAPRRRAGRRSCSPLGAAARAVHVVAAHGLTLEEVTLPARRRAGGAGGADPGAAGGRRRAPDGAAAARLSPPASARGSADWRSPRSLRSSLERRSSVAAVVDVLLLDEVHRGLLGARGTAGDAGVDRRTRRCRPPRRRRRPRPGGRRGSSSRSGARAAPPRPRAPPGAIRWSMRLAVRLLPRRLAVVVRARPLRDGVALVEQVVDAAVEQGVLAGQLVGVALGCRARGRCWWPGVRRSCLRPSHRPTRRTGAHWPRAPRTGNAVRPPAAARQGHWAHGSPRHQRHRLRPARRPAAARRRVVPRSATARGRARRAQRRGQDHAAADRRRRRRAARGRRSARSGGLGVMRQVVGRIDDDRSIRDLLASLAPRRRCGTPRSSWRRPSWR